MRKAAIILALLIAGSALASEPVITCEPRTLRGVPGQPIQLEVTVTTDHVLPIKLMVPHMDILHPHSVEKIPIQRTREGRYIQKRILIWQGLEAGSTSITNLTVSFQGLEKSTALRGRYSPGSPAFQTLEKKVPRVEIVIDEVEPATPPKPEKPNSEKLTRHSPPVTRHSS